MTTKRKTPDSSDSVAIKRKKKEGFQLSNKNAKNTVQKDASGAAKTTSLKEKSAPNVKTKQALYENKKQGKDKKCKKKKRLTDITSDIEKGKIKIATQFPTSSKYVSANWNALKDIIASDKKKATKSKNRTASTEEDKHGKKSACDKSETSADIWFDGVDPCLLELDKTQQQRLAQAKHLPTSLASTQRIDEATAKLVKQHSFEGLTNAVAMDCEMVGVGFNGSESVLARVSLVNMYGNCIYDTFVKPREEVTDYRTHVSGVRPADLQKGEDFDVVQKKFADIMKGRILVGHAVHNDLKVLYLSHPRGMIRDTQKYKPLQKLLGSGKRPGLKRLTEKALGVRVQEGEHSSIQDAQATMRLYTMHKCQWERDLKLKKSGGKKPQVATTSSDGDIVITTQTVDTATRKEKKHRQRWRKNRHDADSYIFG